MAEKQYVFNFKDTKGMGKDLLGGKGIGLSQMTLLGIPIPEGFTVTTEACNLYYASKKTVPDYLVNQIYSAIKDVEKDTGKNFGGTNNPLLVSVRSGARVSMPGMMDTVLNLGLTDVTVEVFVSRQFAYIIKLRQYIYLDGIIRNCAPRGCFQGVRTHANVTV